MATIKELVTKYPQDAITKSDKRYIKTLGLNPDTTTIFDLFEQLESQPFPTTSREAVNEHYAVIKRVLDICRETAVRACELRDTAVGKEKGELLQRIRRVLEAKGQELDYKPEFGTSIVFTTGSNNVVPYDHTGLEDLAQKLGIGAAAYKRPVLEFKEGVVDTSPSATVQDEPADDRAVAFSDAVVDSLKAGRFKV